jgi:hypothetical protein
LVVERGFGRVRLRVRPARVAVLAPRSPNWIHGARRIVGTVSRAWGGAGYVIVPWVPAPVGSLLLELTSGYDPDYLVAVPLTFADWRGGDPASYGPGSPGWRPRVSEPIGRLPNGIVTPTCVSRQPSPPCASGVSTISRIHDRRQRRLMAVEKTIRDLPAIYSMLSGTVHGLPWRLADNVQVDGRQVIWQANPTYFGGSVPGAVTQVSGLAQRSHATADSATGQRWFV